MRATVACVWVHGHVPFTLEYVTRLASMVRRALGDVELVCLTDRPWQIPRGIRAIPIPSPAPGVKGWWSKVRLFDPRLKLSGRVLYLDLDVLVVGSLEKILAFPAPFALVPDGAPAFLGKGRRGVVKRFNSSVMAFDAGTHAELFTKWTPHVAGRLWGDQDWIGERAPDAAAMPAAWFPRLSEVEGPPWDPDVAVVLAKKPKNHQAARELPWFREAWA